MVAIVETVMTILPILGYWNSRGNGQPIRFLLEYTGTPYEEKRYFQGPPPSYNKSNWLDEKFNLGLPFPNLPYYIDGENKLTQSKAILRYIARKNNLTGITEDEILRVDLIEKQGEDFRVEFIRLCYNPDFENLKPTYLKTLQSRLKEYSDYLGTYPWFAGNNITYVDFTMYEQLYSNTILDSTCLENFPNLSAYITRFENLDKIANYLKSDKYIKYPLNGRSAKFGGQDNEEPKLLLPLDIVNITSTATEN